MGGTTSHCVADRCHGANPTDGPLRCVPELLEGSKLNPGHCGPPRCDIVDECVPEKAVGLTDKECADVLLVQAVVRGDLPDIQKALNQGASVDNVAELSINMGESVNKRARQVTPLMRACSLGYSEVVSCLLEKRANTWRTDGQGWTPLCYALGAGELDIARAVMAASKSKQAAERQKAVLHKFKQQVLDLCDENAGSEVVESVRKEMEDADGFLAQDFRRV